MTDAATLREALRDHRDVHEDATGAFTVPTARLDNEVSVGDDRISVAVHLPRLRTVVADGSPAPVVVEDWFDTLRRRLGDAYDVTRRDAAAEAAITRGEDAITVTYRLVATDHEGAADDAKALVDYAVGTYLQGAIPGYEYDEPMRSLLTQARRRGRGDEDGGSRA